MKVLQTTQKLVLKKERAAEVTAALPAESGSLQQQTEDSRLPTCALSRVPLGPSAPAAHPDATSPLRNEPVTVGQSGTATFPDRCHCSIHHTPVDLWLIDQLTQGSISL